MQEGECQPLLVTVSNGGLLVVWGWVILLGWILCVSPLETHSTSACVAGWKYIIYSKMSCAYVHLRLAALWLF